MALVKRTSSEAVDQDERTRPRDFDGLHAVLGDTDPIVRRWAARDLAAFPEASAVLVDRLKIEEAPSVREALLMSLTQIGDRFSIEGLVECLRSDDAHLRNEAIDAMKVLPDQVSAIMSELLADEDPDVRIFSVNILESLRHPDVERWLIEVISHDIHVNVCATAVDLLGEVGTEAALEPLEALKRRFPDEPYIAFAADLALKRIREV